MPRTPFLEAHVFDCLEPRTEPEERYELQPRGLGQRARRSVIDLVAIGICGFTLASRPPEGSCVRSDILDCHAGMDRSHDQGVIGDLAKVTEQAQFKIGVTASLARPANRLSVAGP
ncbi:hypothetical protein [Paracoccus aminophilus]|nr:hypothetical protein [Paracoccus aminophilus]